MLHYKFFSSLVLVCIPCQRSPARHFPEFCLKPDFHGAVRNSPVTEPGKDNSNGGKMRNLSKWKSGNQHVNVLISALIYFFSIKNVKTGVRYCVTASSVRPSVQMLFLEAPGRPLRSARRFKTCQPSLQNL